MFDLDPRANVFALETHFGRQPLGDVLVAFGLVNVVGYSEELWASDAGRTCQLSFSLGRVMGSSSLIRKCLSLLVRPVSRS